MPKVFISYRRSDSMSATGRIYDRLAEHFGKQDVFKDVDNIPAGVRYSDYIRDALRQCVVEMVIIGRQWMTVSADEGKRRIDDTQDLVRQEIEAALALGISVLPVLVEGANMPTKASLPESLGELSEINAVEVRSDPDFNRDIERLVGAIERVIARQMPDLRQPASETDRANPHIEEGRWEVVPSPTANTLRSVAMVSASEGWAAGTQNTMLHYIGSQWIPASSDAILSDNLTITNISMIYASNNVGWAVGNRTILYCNGQYWHDDLRDRRYITPAYVSTNLTGVAIVSTTDIWVVGADGIILHCSGNEWEWVKRPTVDWFHKLIARSSSPVNLTGIAMVSPREGWAVGDKGTILHYIGGEWRIARSPTRADLTGIAMVSASIGWAVGDKGTILRYSGGRWQGVKSPTSEYLTSVAMSSSTNGWAVGFAGTMLHYAQGKWSATSITTSNDLYSVTMVSASEGWAVGNNGIILHYTAGA